MKKGYEMTHREILSLIDSGIDKYDFDDIVNVDEISEDDEFIESLIAHMNERGITFDDSPANAEKHYLEIHPELGEIIIDRMEDFGVYDTPYELFFDFVWSQKEADAFFKV